MRSIRRELGMSLVEMTLVLAITGLIVVPLSSIFRIQLRLPTRISAEVSASRQIQKSSLVLIDDAQAARSYTAGTEPDYGTFSWIELAGAAPVAVSARYYFAPGEGDNPGRVLRLLTRAGNAGQPSLFLTGILRFDQVKFQVTEPNWVYDSASGTWDYIEGKVVVSITQVHEAGAEFGRETLVEELVADFRPQVARPVAVPPPG